MSVIRSFLIVLDFQIFIKNMYKLQKNLTLNIQIATFTLKNSRKIIIMITLLYHLNIFLFGHGSKPIFGSKLTLLIKKDLYQINRMRFKNQIHNTIVLNCGKGFFVCCFEKVAKISE